MGFFVRFVTKETDVPYLLGLDGILKLPKPMPWFNEERLAPFLLGWSSHYYTFGTWNSLASHKERKDGLGYLPVIGNAMGASRFVCRTS